MLRKLKRWLRNLFRRRSAPQPAPHVHHYEVLYRRESDGWELACDSTSGAEARNAYLNLRGGKFPVRLKVDGLLREQANV